ncbi:hypothetical protein HID58_056130 [Brassica napus]|uniref:Uncharacterized protein n=1 Tax=Brassica napus TaxID=3708 RepID=A0ABQ8AMF6_BRANA|nr:hypothetical protein HID58_056130 [Brassica napus]
MGVKHCLVDINQLMLSCFLNLNTGFKLCSFDSCSYLLKKLQHSAILQKVFSFEKPSCRFGEPGSITKRCFREANMSHGM